jgi:RimJ/RimL family protein N-acetyltransferase
MSAPTPDSARTTWLQPILEGPTLRLRPLCADDFEALYAAAADPLIWEQHPEPLRYRRDVFTTLFEGALSSGGALLVMPRDSGRVVGTSRYYDWDPGRAAVAIGYTFLARDLWGGPANAEMKRLMLEHAFCRVQTVWFHVGPRNIRSQKALEKIGARYSHREVRPGGGTLDDRLFYRLDAPDFRHDSGDETG